MGIVHVVLTVSFLALLVGNFQASVRSQLALVDKLVSEAKAEALADGGLQLMIAEIAAIRPRDVRLGRRVVDLPGGQIEVTVSDLGGMIDLNHATPALLSNLLLAAGADGAAAEDIASRITAKRAEKPFVSTAEIGRLPGMSPALLRRLLPAITVHSGSQLVDPGAAPRLVLTALAGGKTALVDGYLERRRAGGRLSPLEAPDAGPVIGSGFSISADARLQGRGRLSRSVIVKPVPFAAAGSLVAVDWRAGRETR